MSGTSSTSQLTDSHYDVVVVGSGFGGSVMTYRLAEAGLKVCLLERGRPYPPGSFPRSPYRMARNVWDPSEGKYGMFSIWAFEHLDAVVSSGLGGGSLIYANVLLRKDERWFVKEDKNSGVYEYWPVTRAELDRHYDRVERILNGQAYPFDHSPYDKTLKTAELKQAAERLGLDWHLPKLAITFANDGEPPVPGEPIREEHPNLHRRSRTTCRLCGECDIGCNYGSKNTLDYNYLTKAERLGAHICSLCEVRSFEPQDTGYAIQYVQHDLMREGQKTNTHDHAVIPIHTITADRLVLSAGTLGTPFLLLKMKSRDKFQNLSSRLGTRFCGNGDILSFAINCSDSTGKVRRPRLIECSRGPSITSAIRYKDLADGGEGRGFYIEDGGYPEYLNWLLELIEVPNALWKWRGQAIHLIDAWWRHKPLTEVTGAISDFLESSKFSMTLLPLLGMGRDIPDGTTTLAGSRLAVDWRKDHSGAYFDQVQAKMQQVAAALGGKYSVNPSWYLSRLITVHPLGGCPMGRDATEGVVDSYGRVFNYPGLYIADGSVMPGPVGANPSLTIAALADRFADQLIEDYRRK